MNKELLFQLYAIHSPSGCEKKMRRYLRKQAVDCGATSIETDKYGNLLIIKGESETYPCLAAHMDQVQQQHSDDFRVVEIDGDVLGWSSKCHEQQGLGADDKNGIFICLELLRRFPVMKVVFFVQEETDGHGSENVDLAFFKDCRFVIEPDRKGSSDLITSMCCGSVCSDKFVQAIGYKDYGYKFDVGTFTDVANLVERQVGISCLNLSCGYYCAHTDHEITVLSHLENCLNFVAHIVETCQEVYPFEGGYSRSYGRYGMGHKSYYADWYYDDFWEENKKKKKSSTVKMDVRLLSNDDESYDDDDDYQYYYDGGYYDEDVHLMEEYLEAAPDLSLDQIKACYMADFYATMCLSKESAENEISDIYHMVKDDYGDTYDHDEYWGGEKDDDLAGELVCEDTKQLKKVS